MQFIIDIFYFLSVILLLSEFHLAKINNASGSFQIIIVDTFNVDQSTVSRAVHLLSK